MNYPTIDNLMKKNKNKFLLSNAISQRAKEIGDGSLPYIEEFNVNNPIETAMNEFAANKFEIKVLEGPAAKPLKEIEAKAKEFWSIESLEKKEHKKTKKIEKPTKKKK